ncbi:MAG: UDP-N-acetylglucosamine 1-carboxyvinyltransferase, partial [Lachnospiraceae bacterium]|nr:UDP-N-acetylglucosamine 1-carboxyvinyltransferase [Lachnospiraceae bacterium]
ISIVTESIFENRFKYVDELTKMGASITVEGNTAIIVGVEQYTGSKLSSPDLRAGAALVIAALAADDYSEIYDIQYIERGYEDFPEKLRKIGAHIYMDVVSVGATINIIMAAVMAEGSTTIENAAKEPHVVDLANFLNSMGARIKGAGTDVIRIKGVSSLHGTNYSIIPDQIEAGTFMFAAAATKGDVTIKNVIPKHLESLTAKLLEIGCQIEESDDMVRVVATRRLGRTNVKTLPYPGYPTDMQPQITAVLGLSKGISIVTESIFENRFKYVDELTKMGASITVEGNTAIIVGVEQYTGSKLSSPDLRAGAALVIAALAADDYSEIYDIQYIERGYEDFPEKLRKIGAHIEKIDSEEEKRKFMFKVG